MATKKKELLEQDAPVTETVMSEGETLLADTAQPESLPADAEGYTLVPTQPLHRRRSA